jgi:hypothetical protein
MPPSKKVPGDDFLEWHHKSSETGGLLRIIWLFT